MDIGSAGRPDDILGNLVQKYIYVGSVVKMKKFDRLVCSNFLFSISLKKCTYIICDLDRTTVELDLQLYIYLVQLRKPYVTVLHVRSAMYVIKTVSPR